jgi:hypothetical protein
MEEILNALKKIQAELDEQKTMIRESGKNVTDQVTQNINKILEEKFFIWEEKHEVLKDIVNNQEKRLYFLEKQAKQRNIVFFGIEENELSYENLEINIIRWIEEYLSIKLSYCDIQEVKRIGKKGERPRPIVVTFSTLGIKIKIFKQKKELKDTLYYMKEDYPKYVLEKRKELQEQIKLEREKGNIAKIKYDKLIVIKNNNKRALPISPENTIQPPHEVISQTVKRNKTQQQQIQIRRSSSMTEGTPKPDMLKYLVSKNITNKNNKLENKEMNT